mmetsp:Transcript_27113/g.64020  ORF Transcript_27113/g.64020 Transcript_27113/m.64020 type:complete len:331 (-) Transcript_27113:683-1675(-)
MVQNPSLAHVQRPWLLDVDAVVDVASGMRGVQVRHRRRRVLPCVLRQRAGDGLQRLPKLLDRVLLEPRCLLRDVLEVRCHPQLARAPARHHPRVLRDLLEDVDAVLHGALEVVEGVARRGAQHDRAHPSLFHAVPRDRHAVRASDLVHRHAVRLSDFLGEGGAEAGEGGGAGELADARDLELGRALDDHELVAFAEVKRHVTDRRLRNQHVDACLYDFTHALIHALLLRFRVVHQLLRVLDQDVALGFGRREVNFGSEHNNLGLVHVLDGAFRIAHEHKPFHEERFMHRHAGDFADADVVNIELPDVLGQDLNACVCYERSKEALESKLL